MVENIPLQPNGQVYHESRHNSYRASDGEAAGPSESTPLVRFPESSVPRRRPAATAVVGLLLLILLVGVVIGIYLLVLQNSSENILPPVEATRMFRNSAQ